MQLLTIKVEVKHTIYKVRLKLTKSKFNIVDQLPRPLAYLPGL